MNVIVTAGPTREYLDAVRFISNSSSGRMGYAIAAAFLQAGHRVVLVTGPTSVAPPAGAKVVRVESAREMRAAVMREFKTADCVVMTAAVSDYRPERRVRGKIKKQRQRLTLHLVRNPDILEELGRRKGRRMLVGFALESGNGERNARAKMRRKNLDLVVLNSPAALAAERTTVNILLPGGKAVRLKNKNKEEIAARLLEIVEATMQAARTDGEDRE